MRAPLAIILALLGLALPGIAGQPSLALTATTADGAVLACALVAPGDAMTLTFTHSMYGGAVHETYRMGRAGSLIRERMVAERAAAAEYYAWDGRVIATSDGYEVIGPPFATDALIVRVDARGNHRLTVNGATWHLADAVDAPTRVRIDVMTSDCRGDL